MASAWENLKDMEAPEAARSQRRPAGAARSRSRRKVPWRAIVLGLAALALLGGAGWSMTQVALSNPYFFLSSVELQGAQHVARSQVEDQFVTDRGRSLLRVPLEERRLAIEQIPWIRSASVTRVFPDRIAVALTERVPVAFVWTADGIALLDGEGVIMELPPGAEFRFPVVRGVTTEQSPEERRDRMKLFTEMMADLARSEGDLIAGISEIDLTDPQDARVIVADGTGAVLLHLGQEDFLTRYMLYASQISQWQQKFASVRSVDLRFEGQVVINADSQAPARSSEASSR
jgi:cell division protein FtsQ